MLCHPGAGGREAERGEVFDMGDEDDDAGIAVDEVEGAAELGRDLGSTSGAERSHTFQRLSLYLSRGLQLPMLRGFTSSYGLDPLGDHLSSRSLLKRVDACFS